tara:strand:+ start:425 stop:997 length:573 start_codon:yes stop_codon:yes gene_type:complete
MTNDFILRYEGVYSEDERKRIIKEIDFLDENGYLFHKDKNFHLEDHKTANLGSDNITKHVPAGGSIASFVLGRFQPCLDHYLKTFSILKRSTFLVYDCKVKKIPAGAGFHNWHYENPSVVHAGRHIVLQAYLNDDFEGGETEFLYQNKREKAVAGDVIIFPAGYTHTHRGNAPIGGTKYIATSWAWIQGE